MKVGLDALLPIDKTHKSLSHQCIAGSLRKPFDTSECRDIVLNSSQKMLLLTGLGRELGLVTKHIAGRTMSRKFSITIGTFVVTAWAAAAEPAAAEKTIHFVYMSPLDVAYRAEFEAGVENAARTLQAWFPDELNGKTFALNADVVQWYQTPHNTSWYQTNPSNPAFYAGRFWETATADAFALTGGQFFDPDDIWVLYLDAMPLDGQYIGGTSSVALMAAHDLAGLNGDSSEPVSRWVGGTGHEMGHALGLPHPPDSPGGPDDWSLMYYGYTTFPDTYLRSDDRSTLLNSGYFQTTLTWPPGDFSHDGNVDVVDLAQWEGDFGVNDDSDADMDGDSDGSDFLIWQRNLAGPVNATAAFVPEPSTAIMMFIACAWLSHRSAGCRWR